MSERTSQVGVVLFDLGGVLVEVAPLSCLADSPADLPDEAAIHRLLAEVPQVKGFECGTCSEQEFAREVVEGFGLPWSPAEFLQRFASLITGPCPGTEVFVNKVAQMYQVCCLSNTNPLHWRRACQVTSACRYFEQAFLSCRIGLMKPDPAIYRYVLTELGVTPSRVLFFDDRQENIDAALELGMQAVLVTSLDDMQQALQA